MVLFATTHGARVYGGERWVVNLCRNLDQHRFQAVAALGSRGELWDALSDLRVPVHRQPLAWLQATPRWKLAPSAVQVAISALRLCRLIRHSRARLIHVFGGHALEAVYLASLLCRVPVVATIQLAIRFPPLHNRILARFSRVVAVSSACRQQLLAGGIPAERIVLLPTGIEVEPFLQGDPQSGRAEFGIPPTAPLVGLVSSLEPNKRQDLFLEAAAHVRGCFPAAYFLLVGSDKSAAAGQQGSYSSFLQERVRQLGLGDRVIFAGFRHDMPDVLAALDLFVLCSDQEAFPVTIMEAMASARPVVATAVGGVLDLVQDGDTGLLVPPGDAAALAERMADLLSDPAPGRRLGERGREFALEHLSAQRAVWSNARMYEEVLAAWT